MFRSTFPIVLSLTALAVAIAPIQAVYADETRTDSVQASTPAGNVSTTVQTKKDNFGNSSTRVDASKATAGERSSTSLQADSGPGGSVSASESKSVRANAAGGLTASERKEQHVSTPLGSSDHVSKTSAATSSDGSATVTRHEAKTTTNP